MSILKLGSPGVSSYSPEVLISAKNATIATSAIALQTGGTAYITPNLTAASATASSPTGPIPATNFMRVTTTGAHGLAVGDLFNISGSTGVGGLNFCTFVVYGIDSTTPTTIFYAYCTLTGTVAGTILTRPIHLPGYSNNLAGISVIPQSITGFCGCAYIIGASSAMQFTWQRTPNPQSIQTMGMVTPITDGVVSALSATTLTEFVFFDGLGQVYLNATGGGANSSYSLLT